MVVIVDDDKDLLDMLVFSFESEGFLVKGLENKTKALEFLSVKENLNQISLLILDRMLPDGDGLDIIREIQPILPKQIPVLFLSVLSSEKDVLSGLKYGAIDYIAKPFSLPVLLTKALALINRENA
jgi:DNA-binding response OmpR family regulator